jgi:hypothetical protein
VLPHQGYLPDTEEGLRVVSCAFFSKQEDISAHIDRNPDDGANSKEGLVDIQAD